VLEVGGRVGGRFDKPTRTGAAALRSGSLRTLSI